MVRAAHISEIEQIMALDESVVGSRHRENKIRGAVESGCCFVAMTEAGIAAYGILDYNFYENGFIDLLIVRPAQQRKGYGRMMLDAFKEICRTEKLFTSTNSSNLPMQKLLEGCGFERCGLIHGLDEGDPEIVYRFQREKAAAGEKSAVSIESEAFKIIPMSWEQLNDINRPNQPFTIFGRLVPEFRNGKWTWTEEIYDAPYEMHFPEEKLDYSQYIGNSDKIVFMAYADKECAGQIRLRRYWNRYCYIDDIEVGGKHRRKGIGRGLIDAAAQWAKAGGMKGIMLEAQDVNLSACRFYARYGFALGGVDTMLYGNFPNKDEKALFWYMRLE